VNELKEMLGNLSDKDWRERKEASFNISSSLELIINRVSSITDSLIENLVNGNIDERYWSGEILGRLSPDYYGKKLIEELINNLSDRDYFQVVKKIINSNFEWFSDNLHEIYSIENDLLKTRIVEITSFYPRKDFLNIYESALVSKYPPLIKAALDALIDICDIDKFLNYSFVLNTNFTSLVIYYFEKIFEILKNEDMIFKDILKKISNNTRLEEKSDIIYFLSASVEKNELFESLKKEEYGILSLLMVFNKYSHKICFNEIKALGCDDITLAYFFICMVKDDINEIIDNILNIENSDIKAFIIRNSKIASKIPEKTLEKLYIEAEDYEIKINILKTKGISKESCIIEKIIEEFDSFDKYTKIEMLRFFSSLKDETFVPLFFKNLKDKNWIVRKFAANCIIDYGEDALLYVDEFIFSENKDISYWSYYCKIFLSNEKDVLFLKEVIYSNKSFDIIRLAVKRLCILNTLVSQDVILDLLKSGDDDIKKTIYQSVITNSYFIESALKFAKTHSNSSNQELAESALEILKMRK